jgi:hypothetical protein
MSDLLPDVLPDLKAWLVALDVVGSRVWYRLPKKPSNSPFIRLSRAGGGPQQDAEVPVVIFRATVEIWGLMDSDYEAVRAVALAIEQAAHNVNGPNFAGTNTILLSANVLTGYDSPDPDTGWPRYIQSLVVTARAA